MSIKPDINLRIKIASCNKILFFLNYPDSQIITIFSHNSSQVKIPLLFNRQPLSLN